MRRSALAVVGLAVAGGLTAYTIYPWYCRLSATRGEDSEPLPGDSIVGASRSGYTLAVSIRAQPSEVWPWLVQMGQGRAGFYTHTWVENAIGADIHNADQIVADLQNLEVGDTVRLTPDPYRGRRGQYIVVARLSPPRTLVFRQQLPNRSTGTWAFVLRPSASGTRLLFRRRGSQPSVFDRLFLPGYYFMDMGMLAGIKRRAERVRDI